MTPVKLNKSEIINCPRVFAKASPAACKVYIASCNLPGAQHSFDTLKEETGLGRNVLQRALQEIKALGFAELNASVNEDGSFSGKGWRIEEVEPVEEDHAPAANLGDIMEMSSVDGYMIKYRTEGELQYKQSVYLEIRKSKEYRAVLLELDCSRDVFLDRYLAYVFEEDVPPYQNRLLALLKSHDKYMKQEARSMSGRQRQTTNEEYTEMVTTIWNSSLLCIPKYKERMEANPEREVEEKDAILQVLHKTDFTIMEIRLFVGCIPYCWILSAYNHYWAIYTEHKEGFKYQAFINDIHDIIGRFRWWVLLKKEEQYLPLQEQRAAHHKAVWKQYEREFTSLWNKVKDQNTEY